MVKSEIRKELTKALTKVKKFKRLVILSFDEFQDFGYIPFLRRVRL